MQRGKNKDYKIAIIVALIVTTVAITIGYASFSQTLTISGDATVNHSAWIIKFKNLSSANLTGTAEEVSAPEISGDGTTISSYNVKFTTPGDSVTYTFDVANEGTFNAKISSVNIPTPVCTGTGDNAANDSTNVCNHLVYTLTYADGTAINIDDKLNRESTASLKLTLTYKDDITASELPNNDVAVSNLSITMNYDQTT